MVMDKSTDKIFEVIITGTLFIVVSTGIILGMATGINYLLTHHDEITIADLEGNHVRDTDGNVWEIHFDDPFEGRELAIGKTMRITWHGLNRPPSVGEPAVFDGWVE